MKINIFRAASAVVCLCYTLISTDADSQQTHNGNEVGNTLINSGMSSTSTPSHTLYENLCDRADTRVSYNTKCRTTITRRGKVNMRKNVNSPDFSP